MTTKKANDMGHTKGEWRKVYVSGVCIGVGASEESKVGNIDGHYERVVCNSILPDTDEEYEQFKNEIESDMTLISAAPDMYEVLKEIVEKVEDGCSIEIDEILEVKIEDAKQALKKAKGEDNEN